MMYFWMYNAPITPSLHGVYATQITQLCRLEHRRAKCTCGGEGGGGDTSGGDYCIGACLVPDVW